MFKANEFMTMSVASAKRECAHDRCTVAQRGRQRPPERCSDRRPRRHAPTASRSAWNRDGPCCTSLLFTLHLPGRQFLGSRWRTAELGARRLLGVGAWAVARCSSESPAPPAEKPWRQSSFL